MRLRKHCLFKEERYKQSYIDKCFSSVLLKPDTDLSGRDLWKREGKGQTLGLRGLYSQGKCWGWGESLDSADNEDIDPSKLPPLTLMNPAPLLTVLVGFV